MKDHAKNYLLIERRRQHLERMYGASRPIDIHDDPLPSLQPVIPPVAGGQGRTDDEVSADAEFLTLLICGLIGLVILLVVNA